MLLSLLRAGIAVYSPHSAFDNCKGGINDQLAELLGLAEVGPLRPGQGAKQTKLVVFVPEDDLAAVSDGRCSPPAPDGSGNMPSAVSAFSVRAPLREARPATRRSGERVVART